MSATDSQNSLTRKQAAAYLATLGYPISPAHLGNLAANNNRGKGPPFLRFGWRTVRYRRDDLKTWFDSRAERVE